MTEQTTQPATTDLAMPEPITLGDLAERPQASLMLDPRAFDHMQRVAKVFAASKMVPVQYQGNVADCVIALESAHRLGVSVSTGTRCAPPACTSSSQRPTPAGLPG